MFLDKVSTLTVPLSTQEYKIRSGKLSRQPDKNVVEPIRDCDPLHGEGAGVATLPGGTKKYK